MNNDFCPELQLPCILDSVEIRGEQKITVKTFRCEQCDYPSPIGKKVAEVTSYPAIFEQLEAVDFIFEEYFYFNIREEQAPAISSDENGEGKTFQRLLDSKLIELHKESYVALKKQWNSIRHYRLILQDQILDVVTTKPPTVIRKPNSIHPNQGMDPTR
jgi:hypothetical protein